MDNKKIILFDKLIKQNTNAYIKLMYNDIPIYTDFFDFEYIRESINYHKNGKMKFKTINDLPILLENIDIEKYIFDILYNQLLTGSIPKFATINDQINYVLLLEQLTGGNSIEIQEIIKDVKFEPIIYTIIIDYGINYLNYINKHITINEIISAILSKNKLLVNSYTSYNVSLCKYNLKCKCHYDSKYTCRYKHTNIEITNKIKKCIVKDLSKYNILYLGNKQLFLNRKYSESNYDCVLLSEDDMLYEIIFENDYAFASNPQKFVDREKYEYNVHDKYEEEISIQMIDNKFIKLRKVALFKPYNCCGSIFYHTHGN